MSRKKTPLYTGLQSAGKISGGLTKKLLSEKKNFLASLLYDWPLIVGASYAQVLKPRQVSFPKNKNNGATLHLSAMDGSTALLMHHIQPFILERVNQFIGYSAFQKIMLHQTVMDSLTIFHSPPANSSLPLSESDSKELADLLAPTPEGELKEVLKKLGTSLYGMKASYDLP